MWLISGRKSMAKRNLAESGAIEGRVATAESVSDSLPFDRLELQVIALGRREAERWLHLPRLVLRALGRLLDLADARPLANPQLEALRRFAIWARLAGDAPPPAEIDRFLSAGFSPVQVRALTGRTLSSAR
jgi:hypothetical protein